MKELIFIIPLLFICSGCAGLGFDKQTTLMPDEISISADSNPTENWEIDEVTGGLKWKLK